MGVYGMTEKTIITERLLKKEAEIQVLEEKLKAARVYVQALRDILYALNNEALPQASETVLRPGSSVALAREAILKAGKPVHINDLVIGLGKGFTRESKASLTSSLSAYVRKNEIFTRPSPNTFGLLELGHDGGNASIRGEPPPSFGELDIPLERDEESIS
jgi:hypothetical protein